jgi:predicted restriction endonuclease
MHFTKLDDIYHIIYNSNFGALSEFDIEDVNIVQKLKFPKLDLNKYLTTIRSRSTQFRTKIIETYNNCALTNINNTLCDAAHILPYCDCNDIEKYDTHNGILLSKNMHSAFDKNYFKIDEHTCRVVILYDHIRYINIADLELDTINNKYIPQLDNAKSKYFLSKRNNKIE